MQIKVDILTDNGWKKHGVYKSIDDVVKEAFALGEFGVCKDVRAKVIAQDGKI